MNYQVLARKWRPRNFDDMVGQGHVLRALINALNSDRIHHAYLFAGTRGVGKTTLARILAKCLNCEKEICSEPCGECSTCIGIDEGRFVDLIEVDAASRAKVEETRDLMDNVQYAPTVGRFKVYLIDEVHMFSNHSFNALLKTLEEPPPHVKFLLVTTEPKKLPITILSRCLQFNLKHLTVEQIGSDIRRILKIEQIPTDDASVHLIASAANGSMRDALSLLDQAIAYNNGELQEKALSEMLGTIDNADVTGLIEALIEGDAQSLLAGVDEISTFSPDYDVVLAEILSRLHKLAVAQALSEDSESNENSTQALLGRIGKEEVQLYYQIGLVGRRDMMISPDPRMAFEMTLIRMLAFQPLKPLEKESMAEPKLVQKLDQSGAQVSAQESIYSPIREIAQDSNQRVAADTVVDTFAAPHALSNSNTDWQKIIDEMDLAGLVQEFARHCVLKQHSENSVHLILASSHEHLLKTTQKDRLQDAVKIRFGEQVKLVITIEQLTEEISVETRERAEKEKHIAAVNFFIEDPNVKAVIETFDGTLDSKSIRSY